ncbi:MAG: YgfZ/GcvT domain-containing protein [Actinomycetota bacterium]|jgi:folate-binding protein YgfZ
MSTSEASPGFVEHHDLRVVEVGGSDARGWLNDLVTGPVGSLGPGKATRSLLLTPTGRIRADFTVADPGEGAALLLLQNIEQPEPIDALLARYVLSSDVQLADATERLVVFSVVGVERPPVPGDLRAVSPSILGTGFDLLADRATAPEVARSLSSSMPAADGGSLERRRVEAGIPRFGTDYGPGALPAEAALETAIDFTKGCFLGQESVAKVRNLGHPQTTLLALRAATQAGRGDGVYAGGAPVGTITSTAVADGGTMLIARVRWNSSRAGLSLADGTSLERRALNET